MARSPHARQGAAFAIASLLITLTPAPPASAEVVRAGGVRIAYDASLRPKVLPRVGTAPVAVRFSIRLAPLQSEVLPQLRLVRIAISRHGYLDSRGLPVCRLRRIQTASSDDALRGCRRSLVGEGRFAARMLIPDQLPFPSRGRVLAFYGRYGGRPAILAHVYGTTPLPLSYTIPFLIRRSGGSFGTVLSASLGPSVGRAGYITLLRITLGGRFGHLRAGCPAPAGASGSLFPLAALSIGFPQRRLSANLLRGCRVR